jgi:hypothetical protein
MHTRVVSPHHLVDRAREQNPGPGQYETTMHPFLSIGAPGAGVPQITMSPRVEPPPPS